MPTQPENSQSFFKATCLEEEKLVECISYAFICPIFILLGIIGCGASVFLMSGPGFKGVTFYYLRALSVTDFFYLITVCGNMVQILLWRGEGGEEFVSIFYLTHIDHILCNTCISASGFLIILLTIDRYRCICQPTEPRDSHPGLCTGLALLVSFLLQIPRFLEEGIEEVCVSINQNSSALLNRSECDCGVIPVGQICKYQNKETDNLRGQYPWTTYVILTEILIKILPSIVLLVLNVLMADRFYHVVERRGRLQAKRALSLSSELFPPVKKPALKLEDTRFTLETSVVDNSPGGGRQRRASRIGHGLLIGIKTFSKRDKNIITLLFLLSLVFAIANIPMAVGRICKAFNVEAPWYPTFNCVINVLEVCFASSNFYLYCLCNAAIRRKVNILTTP